MLDAMASPGVSDTDRFRMTAIILKLADDAARQVLEALMRTTEYQKTFIEQIHDEGIAEGKAQGMAQGMAEGEVRGEVKALLRILDVRGIVLTAEQRARVTTCTDPAQLERWLDRAVTAASAADVLAA